MSEPGTERHVPQENDDASSAPAAPPAFVRELTERIDAAQQTLDEARRDDDPALRTAAEVELEDLLRLAERHDVPMAREPTTDE